MNIAKIKKSLKRLCKLVFNIITSKKTLILILGWLIFRRLRNFPEEITTSKFLDLLKSTSSPIKTLLNLDNRLVICSQWTGTDFMCNYTAGDLENFQEILMDKKVDFDFLTGIPAFLNNPINQIYLMSWAFGVLLVNEVYPNIQKFKSSLKKREALASNEDVLQDFIANENIKGTINMIIDQLKFPGKYAEKRIKLIRGCLVYGKPGTGKTLLARCLSRIEGVTFINTCASEYVELYVGSGAKRVREIFKLARENRPAIIFIDELESIGTHRSSDTTVYTNNSERYSTLNQLLAEMDGVVDNDNIVVIAATNREDLLDSALVRPGRFSVKLSLPPPDFQGRFELFKFYLTKYSYDNLSVGEDVINDFAKKSENLTGANIESIVNDAASYAMASNEKFITKPYLEDAYTKNFEEFLRFNKYEMKNSHY